jgi:hypothetical protein
MRGQFGEDLVTHSVEVERGRRGGGDVKNGIGDGYNGGLDGGEAEGREALGYEVGVELFWVRVGESVGDGPLDVIVL